MNCSLSRRRDGAVPVRRALLPGVLLAALGACATASGVPLGVATFAPRSEDHPVPVFDAFEDLPRPVDKVGRVVGEGSDLASFASVVAAMQVEVRALGGDALVLTGGSLLLSDGGPDGCGVDVDRAVHGLAVRWR